MIGWMSKLTSVMFAWGMNPEEPDDPNAKVVWEQCGGVVQRGAPHTLILAKLCPKKTGFRAPGPGPIRKKEWKLFANAHLKGRNIILHSDGARSYRLKLPGVIHGYVVHQQSW